MSRLLWLLPLLGAACTGLHLENGNSYPCDFSEPPGERDAVCQPGDICGTNNVCQPFIYEGPRFEGKATLPEYGPDSGEGALLHPLVLNSPARDVSADLPLSPIPTGYLRQDDGVFEVEGGKVTPSVVVPPNLPAQFGEVKALQTFSNRGKRVLIRSKSGRLAVRTMLPPRLDLVQFDGGDLTVAGVRVVGVPSTDGGLRIPEASPVAWNTDAVGEVERASDGSWSLTPWVLTPGPIFDVASLTLPGRHFVFALQPDAIVVVDRSDPADAGLSVVATLDTLSAQTGGLKTDPGGRVITAVRNGSLLPSGLETDVLSTFQVNIDSEGAAFTAPWPDCTPCRGGDRIELVAPSVRSGSPTVDVVCKDALLPMVYPLRVVGSVALTQFDACRTEDLEPSIDLAQIAGKPGPAVQWDSQAGLLLGGENGELWSGETLTTLLPAFLDRVPFDVAPALAGTTPSLAVITDDYLAIQQTPDTIGPLERLNGFRRVSPPELNAGDNLKLLGFVHGVSGWGIISDGTLIQLKTAGVPELKRGPQLLTASEDPIRSSIGGEAFIANDGGTEGFFLAADDSLYFLQLPDQSSNDEVLLPDLTPEPSVPIRSLALERTPVGTDPLGATGDVRARGYLVTSRNVYSWELSGDPSRWSATPRVLTAGEPVEVWFDAPRSALGRVGYRDGQIFSLPGGYQLAEALPPGSRGEPSLVLDFENLGGWPVAYTSTGLFIAGWEQVEGQLQNRFSDGVNKPMKWTEVKLAGSEATPWLVADGPERLRGAKPGKLFVASDPPIPQDAGVPDAGTQLHRLLIFNDDEVRQVARHLRKLSDLR